MMMESIGLQKDLESGGAGWHRGAWLVVVAGALLVLALGLSWFGALRTASEVQLTAIVSELQLRARDVGALSALALAGDQSALAQLRDRTASVESTLAVLISGGQYKDEVIRPAADFLQPRLSEFGTRWTEFKGRTDTLLAAAASSQGKTAKDSGQRRLPEKRASSPPVQKAAATRALGAEAGTSPITLLNNSHALAAKLDEIRAELDGRQPQAPGLLYLAGACVLGAIAVLVALGVSISRSGLALNRAPERPNAELLEVLRPAMRTLHIEADAAALADPAALGRRLSDEILVVVDGIKTLVKALGSATAEADKFAVVGHLAAQALADAEQKAQSSSASLQATARRIAAVYAAVSAAASEVQQQCARVLELAGNSSRGIRDAVRETDRLRDCMDGLLASYARSVAMNSEIAQGLLEVADLLTQAERFALRAGDRLAAASADEAVAFAKDVRSYLGPAVTILKQTTELAQGAGREADDFSNALAQAAALAGDAARTGLDGSSALDGVGIAVQELSAKIASMSRLASGAEASQLLAALDEIVRQIAQSSASARQVIDATKNAANHIEELAKLLNTMKPS